MRFIQSKDDRYKEAKALSLLFGKSLAQSLCTVFLLEEYRELTEYSTNRSAIIWLMVLSGDVYWVPYRNCPDEESRLKDFKIELSTFLEIVDLGGRQNNHFMKEAIAYLEGYACREADKFTLDQSVYHVFMERIEKEEQLKRDKIINEFKLRQQPSGLKMGRNEEYKDEDGIYHKW